MKKIVYILAAIFLSLGTYLMIQLLSDRNQRITRSNELIEKEKNMKLVYPPDRKPNFNFGKEPSKTKDTDVSKP